MLKRHIPTNIEYDTGAVCDAVRAWSIAQGVSIGPKGYGFAGRIFFIDATPNAGQIAALRAAVVPLFSSVGDL